MLATALDQRLQHAIADLVTGVSLMRLKSFASSTRDAGAGQMRCHPPWQGRVQPASTQCAGQGVVVDQFANLCRAHRVDTHHHRGDSGEQHDAAQKVGGHVHRRRRQGTGDLAGAGHPRRAPA